MNVFSMCVAVQDCLIYVIMLCCLRGSTNGGCEMITSGPSGLGVRVS